MCDPRFVLPGWSSWERAGDLDHPETRQAALPYCDDHSALGCCRPAGSHHPASMDLLSGSHLGVWSGIVQNDSVHCDCVHVQQHLLDHCYERGALSCHLSSISDDALEDKKQYKNISCTFVAACFPSRSACLNTESGKH